MNIEIVLIVYFVILNIISFILMGVDKRKAINHQWRVSEKTLWVTAIIGGSIGSILGMRVFRHKTKHQLFTIGMPVILILQVFLLFYLLTLS